VPANAATTIRLIGDDLRAEDLPRLRLDGALLPPSYVATLVSSQEIQLAVPAQAAGQHAITFSNTLGLPRSAAEFLVFTPPSEPIGADLPGTGNRVELVYDNARARLYAVDISEGELERYEWNGTAWQDLGALSVAGIRAATLLRDGRRLAISAPTGVSTLDLTTASGLTLLTDGAFLRCGFGVPNELAVSEFGSVFMTVWGNSCTPYGDVVEYDLLNNSHDTPFGAGGAYINQPSWSYYGALLASSGDGRYLAISQIGDSGQNYGLFDVRTRTYATPKTSGAAGRRMQLDNAGTKVLLNYGVIRNRAGAIQGLLPTNQGARISPDGNRVLIHVHGANGTGFLQLYDVSLPVGDSAIYPAVGAPIPVPYNMGTPDTNIPNSYVTSFGLEWSDDSGLAFVSGSTRIVVVRLP
jgi:hypothetical protein